MYEVMKYIPKGFAKAFNLEFCSTHKYYTGDAYKDSKGEYLKTYYYFNNEIYALKYFDGCFNPFLIKFDTTKVGFGLIMEQDKPRVEQVVRVRNKQAEQHFRKTIGSRFEMM